MKHLSILLLILAMSAQIALAQSRFEVDPTSKYPIRHEDSIRRYSPETIKPDTVSADLLVDDNPIFEMLLTKCSLTRDTLKVKIYYWNEAFDNCISIHIFKSSYSVSMEIGNPIMEQIPKIVLARSYLKLNTSKFEKGKTIRGYIEFSGKCPNKDCWRYKGRTDTIFAKGYFKAVIQ